MLKPQKKTIKFLILTQYYLYNFKQVSSFNTKFKIIKQYFNLVTNIIYTKLILKLLIWFKLTKTQKSYYLYKVAKLKSNLISKLKYQQFYFDHIFRKIQLYFFKIKYRFLFKKITTRNSFLKQQRTRKFLKKYNIKSKEVRMFRLNRFKKPQVKLFKFNLWFFKSTLKKKLKLPKWKIDRLYSFKKYFNNFMIKVKFKKIVISQIKLNDYSLRSKFKTSINIENLKSQYGIIQIKPSGANIFITLTNFYGNVLAHFLLVFLMK